MSNIIKVNGGNASGRVIKLITKSITSDGTYDATDDNANGYSEVNVSLINITKFRYVKWHITSIWGNQYFQVSELGFCDTADNLMTFPQGMSATSSLPLLSIYTIDNLFDGDTNTKIVTEFHSGDVEDITIDFGSGNELDITQYPYYYWGSSDDDETYRGRTPLVWQFFGANESDFSDAVLLDEVTNFTPYVKNKEMAYRGLMVSTMRNSLPLITKSILANGTYDASDDNAIGYSSVTVDVSSPGVKDRLFLLECVGRDTAQIPEVNQLTEGDSFSKYLTFNTTTRKFTVLKSFDAVVVAWVYQYQGAMSPGQGAFYLNGTETYTYNTNGNGLGATGGVANIVQFNVGDEFYVYTRSSSGYPQQYLKIYIENGLDIGNTMTVTPFSTNIQNIIKMCFVDETSH